MLKFLETRCTKLSRNSIRLRMAAQFVNTSATPCIASSNNVLVPSSTKNFRISTNNRGEKKRKGSPCKMFAPLFVDRWWKSKLCRIPCRENFPSGTSLRPPDNSVTMRTSESPSLQFPARQRKNITATWEICARTNYVVGEQRKVRRWTRYR